MATEAAEVFAAVAAVLTGGKQRKLVAEALQQCFRLQSDWDRKRLLEDLAPLLDRSDLFRAEQAARGFYSAPRSVAMAALAPRLSGKQRADAWGIAVESAVEGWADDSHSQGRRLQQIVGKIDDNTLLDRCLDAAAKLKEEQHAGWVLEAMAPRLTGERLQRVLDIALAFTDVGAKTTLLVALYPQVPAAQKQKTATAALDAALAINEPLNRAFALRSVLQHLGNETRVLAVAEGLKAAELIEEPGRRADTLNELRLAAGGEINIVNRIRDAMVQQLRAASGEEREQVLRFCSARSLFQAPILSETAVASLVESVLSIHDWPWL